MKFAKAQSSRDDAISPIRSVFFGEMMLLIVNIKVHTKNNIPKSVLENKKKLCRLKLKSSVEPLIPADWRVNLNNNKTGENAKRIEGIDF